VVLRAFFIDFLRLSEVRVVRSGRCSVRQFVSGALALALAAALAGARLQAEEFHYPLKPAAAEHGPVYVADLRLPGILVVKDGKIETYFAASKKLGTPLCRIRSLAVDRDGKVLAGDSSTREVYRFDQPGKPTPLIKGAEAGIGIPMAIAVDSKGNIFVADLEVHWIWKLAPTGGAPKRFAEVQAPVGMTIDPQDRLWVVSNGNDQLLRISPDAKIEVVVAGRPFQHPNDVALGPDESAYVSDGYAHTIWKVTTGAKPQAWINGAPLVNPVGLAWHDSSLIIADPNPKAKTGQVYKADAAGKLSPLAGK
jgi:sugar lactone lactonase YvrE